MGLNWSAIFTSKTMWGGAMMFVNAIAKQFGYDLGDTSEFVDAVVNVIGVGLVFLGRITATKSIVNK